MDYISALFPSLDDVYILQSAEMAIPTYLRKLFLPDRQNKTFHSLSTTVTIDEIETQTEDLTLQSSETIDPIEIFINKFYSIPDCNMIMIESIVRRLRELREINIEDKLNLDISKESLNNFFKLLYMNPNLTRPSISESPDGNLYIEWRKHSVLIGIEFISDNEVLFVMLSQDLNNQERLEITGRSNTEKVIDIFLQNKVGKIIFANQ